MPIFRLPVEPLFPDPSWANPDGLLAVGGDLSTPRLLVAYRNGIYPWFSEGQPILWWSPNPRMVLALADLHVPRSLRRTLRKRAFNVTVDVAFRDVVAACQGVERPGQHGTWITADMVEAYVRLHEAGAAHSVEAWDMNGNLVGGLYGVSIGRMFAGESMFTHTPDASKVAFITMALQLRRWGFPMIDCQMYTHHLARFGAAEVPRETFLEAVRIAVNADTGVQAWTLDADILDELQRCPS